MDLIIRAVIGIIIAALIYFAGTALIHFHAAHLIFGLVAVAVLLLVLFGAGRVRP